MLPLCVIEIHEAEAEQEVQRKQEQEHENPVIFLEVQTSFLHIQRRKKSTHGNIKLGR